MHEKNLQSSHYSRIHIQLFRYTISIYFLQIKKLQIYPISLSFPILQVIRATIITFRAQMHKDHLSLYTFIQLLDSTYDCSSLKFLLFS